MYYALIVRGKMDIVNCKNLKDLYTRLGGSVYCADSTTGYTKKWHQDRVDKWLAVIKDVRPIMFNPDFSAKQFKELLYKHFPLEVLDELPYVLGLCWVESVYKPAKFNHQLKFGLKQWLNDAIK